MRSITLETEISNDYPDSDINQLLSWAYTHLRLAHVAQECWTEFGQTVTRHEVQRFIKPPGRTAPSYLLNQEERAMRATAIPLQTIDSIGGSPDLIGRPCRSPSMDDSRGRRR